MLSFSCTCLPWSPARASGGIRELLCCLLQWHLTEQQPERAIVDCLEDSGQNEGETKHESRSLQEYARDDRTGGCSDTARERGHRGRGSPLCWGDQRHRIRLA